MLTEAGQGLFERVVLSRYRTPGGEALVRALKEASREKVVAAINRAAEEPEVHQTADTVAACLDLKTGGAANARNEVWKAVSAKVCGMDS